jgi:MFS family permease
MVRFLTPAEVFSMMQKQMPWYREMSGYHWWILCVATMGWMFDTMDQRLFVLSRSRAVEDLLGPSATQAEVTFFGTVATALLLIGWATGGLIFGILGDRWGRAKTMFLAIFVYSIFTGLSALSVAWWDFALYRFLTGVGVGGEFAAGVSLVAEVMPAVARPHALGLLQAMSAVGNIMGSLIGLVLLPVTLPWGWAALGIEAFPGWRLMFLVGVAPALIFVFFMRHVKEPEAWVAAKQAAKEAAGAQAAHQELGSWRELLGDRRWRHNTLIGVTLVLAGAIGLWGVGFWSPELIRGNVLADAPKQHQDRVASIATALQDVGAFLGILVFTWLTARLGRRGAFGLSFLLALGVTTTVFGAMTEEWQIYWMIPLMGFATLSVFGGYAIYLPELFPTRLRSTGTGFCYNVARYLTAVGLFVLGFLALFYEWLGVAAPFRWAAVTVASIYVLGLVILPFAPETKGKPLPE